MGSLLFPSAVLHQDGHKHTGHTKIRVDYHHTHNSLYEQIDLYQSISLPFSKAFPVPDGHQDDLPQLLHDFARV